MLINFQADKKNWHTINAASKKVGDRAILLL
jgi:hypothetical protein